VSHLPRSPFVFALGQPGAEPALRGELMSFGLSPAFGLDGFVSAKSSRGLGVDELPPLVLGRRVCLSLGKLKDVNVERVARDLGAVVHREHGERGAAANTIGAFVVTVVERPGGAFVGVHRHREGLSPDPCGDARLEVPADAPSRAWLKVEEARRIWPLPVAPGDVVVEVGCAPGGQSRALLDLGLRVTGIDANAMDERVLARPTFTHLRCAAQQVDAALLRQSLAGPARLLVMDVNQRPQAALATVAAIARATRDSLRGGLFTLKLGDWSLISELPRWRARIEHLLGAGTTTSATQLPSNRVEVTVTAHRTDV
jgi:23S rRNA C2498 (ribose-2'-O)-methylase RlmM